MNNAEKKQLGFMPREALDRAVNERFGEAVKCNTFFDIFGSMGYVTTFEAKGALRKEIDAFIAGYTAGNQELGVRLMSPDKFLN